MRSLRLERHWASIDAGVRRLVVSNLALPATSHMADAPRVIPEAKTNRPRNPIESIKRVSHGTRCGMEMMIEAPLQYVRSCSLAQADEQVEEGPRTHAMPFGNVKEERHVV